MQCFCLSSINTAPGLGLSFKWLNFELGPLLINPLVYTRMTKTIRYTAYSPWLVNLTSSAFEWFHHRLLYFLYVNSRNSGNFVCLSCILCCTGQSLDHKQILQPDQNINLGFLYSRMFYVFLQSGPKLGLWTGRNHRS